MRNLLAAIVVLAISATACSNPRTLRFTETNQAEVLAAVEKSKRIPEDEKQLLREHVANVAIAQAAVGALANMAAMLGGQKTPASPISPPLTLVGKTVDEAIADARRLKQAEVARKGEEERERQERKHEFEAYLPKLELRDITFTIGGGNRFDPERHAFVKGEVRNGGDRTITRLQTTAYLLDAEGRPIAEDKCYPVIKGGFSDKGPLRPNYVAPMLCMFKAPPKEWAEKVDAKITDVEFEKAK